MLILSLATTGCGFFESRETDTYTELNEVLEEINERYIEDSKNLSDSLILGMDSTQLSQVEDIKFRTKLLTHFIDSLRVEIRNTATSTNGDTSFSSRMHDYDTPSAIMIGNGEAKKLKENLLHYYHFLISIHRSKEIRREIRIIQQGVPEPFGDTLSWENGNFEYVPAIGVITTLTMVKSNIIYAQNETIKHFFK